MASNPAGYRIPLAKNSDGYRIPLVTAEYRRVQNSAGKEFRWYRIPLAKNSSGIILLDRPKNFAEENSDKILGHFYSIFKGEEFIIMHISRRICLF